MRNPGMLGSYSVQFMELAMHCLFSLDYFQRHQRHSLRYPQIRQTPQGGRVHRAAGRGLADAEAEFIEQNLATKRDIADIKRDIADVKRDIKELEVTLRNESNSLMSRCVARSNSLMSRSNRSVRTLPATSKTSNTA